ncbi:hypothetical protein G3N57_37915, partial [Paraburkholderia sp. Se-20369]|nr:hypothetical protein [Paraburkholderia sp. Se-20369]
RDTLRGAPAALGLALDRTPAQRDYRLRQVDVTLDRARVEQLRRTATDTRTTVFTLLLGLWATVLARFGHDREVVIGIPVSGRNQPALTGVVGFLSNTIPLRVECDGGAALAPFAQGLQRRVLDAMLHQDPPFTQILDAAQVERVRDRNPLVQAMFVLSDVRPWALKLDDVAATFVREPGAVARADISLVLRQHDTGIEGAIEFAGDVMSDALASRIAAGFMRVIEAALDRPEQPLAAHSLLGDDERAALLR